MRVLFIGCDIPDMSIELRMRLGKLQVTMLIRFTRKLLPKESGLVKYGDHLKRRSHALMCLNFE